MCCIRPKRSAVMDLAVGEDRCANWPCEDEMLCESVHEKTSWGEFGCEDMCVVSLGCGCGSR